MGNKQHTHRTHKIGKEQKSLIEKQKARCLCSCSRSRKLCVRTTFEKSLSDAKASSVFHSRYANKTNFSNNIFIRLKIDLKSGKI